MILRPSTATALALAWVLGPFGASVLAQSDPRIDEQGRDLRHNPPPIDFDHRHLKIEIDIPTMDEPRLTGRVTLTAAAVGPPRSEMRLDAAGLTIRGVSSGGRPLAFSHDGRELVVRFGDAIAPGAIAEVVIDYDCTYRSSGGVGLTWTPGSVDSDSITVRSPQIHSQGQPEFNSRWFPCRDFPNDHLTTELIATVEDGYQVCSNGRLVYSIKGADGRVRWHWTQDTPHASYLVALVVGRFGVVDVSSALAPGVPLYVYTIAGTEDDVRESFARTGDMIAHFSRQFDEPYPWAKYAQLMVRNFRAGAMENTSATTFADMFARMPREAVEPIIAHELVHQWFGDLVGYKSWEHLWLGEGWASFGEALWAEAAAAPDQSRRAYQRTIAGFFAAERRNRPGGPETPGMVSALYGDPDEPFFRPNNVYSKGAIVLHMLRAQLGDEAFFAGTALYLDRFRYGVAETDDFRRCMEEVSGRSLERFFYERAYRSGMPQLRVSAAWDAPSSSLRVSVEQTQRIDADNPAFQVSLPLYVTFGEGVGEYVYVDLDGRSAESAFPFAAAPADVVVDPNLSACAPARIEKSLAMWIHQADHGPTVFAQLEAVEHLAGLTDSASAAALARLAADPTTDELVRKVAGRAGAVRLTAAEGRP